MATKEVIVLTEIRDIMERNEETINAEIKKNDARYKDINYQLRRIGTRLEEIQK